MTKNSNSLERLIAEVAETWPFDQTTYPGITTENTKLFAIRHILLHIYKSAGSLAAIVERAEHGHIADNELHALIGKQFVNILRLAEVAGMSADDLIKHIQQR